MMQRDVLAELFLLSCSKFSLMAISHKETRSLLNKLAEKVFNEERMISSLDIAKLVTWEITGGLPYMGYIHICGLKGYSF